jgi:hypothetical protein
MHLEGWGNWQMVDRCGPSASDQRAMAAHRPMASGDRL